MRAPPPPVKLVRLVGTVLVSKRAPGITDTPPNTPNADNIGSSKKEQQ